MREAALFNENLVLKRVLSTKLGSKSLRISDMVENQGFEAQPLMIMYHFNFGFPFLDECLKFVVPSIQIRPRDSIAEKGIKRFDSFSCPIDQFQEHVFYHKVAADDNGDTCTALFNEKLNLGVYIKYNTENLPNLVQWKSMMSGDYVLGIEPSNCFPEGRIREREQGTLRIVSPFEKLHFNLELGILEGRNEFDEIEEKIKGLSK